MINVKELEELPYSKLQQEVIDRFPDIAPKTVENARKQLEFVSLEDLLVMTEYIRRNLAFGVNEFAMTTYEEAVKNVYLPELMRRLGQILEREKL